MKPLFELVINEDDHSGVTAVALVDNPAIDIGWQAFNKPKEYKFETLSAEKRKIAGPLMIPNMPIPRADSRGEYDVWFSKETIEKIVNKHAKNQYGNRVNPMHESMMILPGIYMTASFIVNKEHGLNPANFELPNGTWFGEFKVENDEIWDGFIKTGIFKGFSVEGYFEDIPSELTQEEVLNLAKVLGF